MATPAARRYAALGFDVQAANAGFVEFALLLLELWRWGGEARPSTTPKHNAQPQKQMKAAARARHRHRATKSPHPPTPEGRRRGEGCRERGKGKGKPPNPNPNPPACPAILSPSLSSSPL